MHGVFIDDIIGFIRIFERKKKPGNDIGVSKPGTCNQLPTLANYFIFKSYLGIVDRLNLLIKYASIISNVRSDCKLEKIIK